MTAVSQKNNFYLFTIILISFLLRVLFLGNHDLIVEEAYYWNYAAHMDLGYIDHPPMVAVLIKLSTAIFGTNEFGVRCPAMLCWLITAYYSYRWCELIQIGTGRFAVLLLSILPFFYLYSIMITPDLPMMACWSAVLYYLYRAIHLNHKHAWYAAGIALGLGLFSKYSIALLAVTTGLFLIGTPALRFWFGRKEPYLAAIIALLLFSPVIYWNATHDWASFAFQSTHRLTGNFQFSLHQLVGILILFLTPIGLIGFGKLLKPSFRLPIDPLITRFLRFYALVPLLVFATFSLTRVIKFNWIGPSLLALLPWLGLLLHHQITKLRHWLQLSPVLIVLPTALFFCVSYGQPAYLNQLFLSKMVDWGQFTRDFYQIASKATLPGKPPVFIALDTYSIPSELAFYQTKQSRANPKLPIYPIYGADMFGFNSLMYKLWNDADLKGKTIVLIGKERYSFQNELVSNATVPMSAVTQVWGKSQGQLANVRPYYYQIVRMVE
ncbi:MAG: glycosyltransferase family 39 protein [Gammaproteobacteria bacterium]|nr:glycosyltransferase family 39 protein [Gammaproteobacteria bacterium]